MMLEQIKLENLKSGLARDPGNYISFLNLVARLAWSATASTPPMA